MKNDSLDMRMLIVSRRRAETLSRRRAETLSRKSAKFFPDAIICIAEEELEDYKEYFDEDRIMTHPNDIIGTGPLRQWVLDNVINEIVVMIDDDIDVCYSQVGFKKRRIEDPQTIQCIVERLAIAAKDSGAKYFGFAVGSIPFSYQPFKPFHLSTWSDGVIGIIGRSVRYDTSLRLREDVDFCLQMLRKNRYVLMDTRYLFAHNRLTLSGGNSESRTSERHDNEMEYLKGKWRKHIRIKKVKGTYVSNLNVER